MQPHSEAPGQRNQKQREAVGQHLTEIVRRGAPADWPWTSQKGSVVLFSSSHRERMTRIRRSSINEAASYNSFPAPAASIDRRARLANGTRRRGKGARILSREERTTDRENSPRQGSPWRQNKKAKMKVSVSRASIPLRLLGIPPCTQNTGAGSHSLSRGSSNLQG